MIELLEAFSIKEILIFVIILALAIKGVIDFIDWAKKRIRKNYKAEQLKSNQTTHVNSQIKNCDTRIDELGERVDTIVERIDYLIDNIELLSESNKDAIKSYITKEHHYFCYEQRWIDDYSLDCLEKRFAHYKKFGGNSFIEDLMKELRSLPKVPPQN